MSEEDIVLGEMDERPTLTVTLPQDVPTDNVTDASVNLLRGADVPSIPQGLTPIIPFSETRPRALDFSTMPSGRDAGLGDGVNNPLPGFSGRLPYKDISLTKWNVKFSGKGCVREFFLAVEENQSARDLPLSYVVKRFHELLSDSALKYFRSIKSTTLTYDQLKTAFFSTFGVADFNFSMERKIRETRQGVNQSIQDYVIDMYDMNQKLAVPILEESLVTIIKYNLHPRYTPCVATNRIKDIDSLLEVCKNFEVFDRPQKATYPLKVGVLNAVASVSTPTASTQVCPKCGGKNHSYRFCPNIPGMICFKCKTPGVITANCLKCNPVLPQKN